MNNLVVTDNEKGNINFNDLVKGYTYKSDKNEYWIFMDRIDNDFFFFNLKIKMFYKLKEGEINFIEGKETVHYAYNGLYELLQHLKLYSPIKEGEYKYIEYDLRHGLCKLENKIYVKSEDLKKIIPQILKKPAEFLLDNERILNNSIVKHFDDPELRDTIINYIDNNEYIDCFFKSDIYTYIFKNDKIEISFSIEIKVNKWYVRHIHLYNKRNDNDKVEGFDDFENKFRKIPVYKKVSYLENGKELISNGGNKFKKIIEVILT